MLKKTSIELSKRDVYKRQGDDVILPLLCLQLPESSFQMLAGAFHLLEGELLTAHEFQLLDAVREYLNLLLQQTLLTFLGHGDFLELTVPDKDVYKRQGQ